MSGWALAWEMMPTLAQRVWPSTTASAVGARDGPAQQLVAEDGRAQRPGVVAQLADLGRRLVDEAQVAVGRAHRHRPEERVGGAVGQHGRHVGRVEVETVAPHQQVQAGRVAAPHLEPVEGRQRLLHRGEHRDGGVAGVAAGQLVDGAGRAQPIAVDGPDRVLELDHRRVDRFEAGAPVGGDRIDVHPVEALVDGRHLVEQGPGPVLDRRHQLAVAHERQHARAPRAAAGRRSRSGGRRRTAAAASKANPVAASARRRGVEQAEHLVGRRWRSVAGTTDDGDDPAHVGGYLPSGLGTGERLLGRCLGGPTRRR